MALELTPGKSAVVLIDLQQGILARSLAPHSADAVVRASADLARACAARGGVVVPVNVGFNSDGADRPPQLVDAPMAIPAGGPPPGYSDLAPEIAALPATVRITKRHWSAFYGTELDVQLRRRGITTLIIAGVATNFGVESTARDGWQHNYAVVIAEDACTSVSQEHHRFSIEKVLPRLARIRSTAEIIAALQ